MVVIPSAIPAVFVTNCTVNGEVQSKKNNKNMGQFYVQKPYNNPIRCIHYRGEGKVCFLHPPSFVRPNL